MMSEEFRNEFDSIQQPENQQAPAGQPAPKKRRHPGVFRRAAGITAAALLFGTVSGGVIAGITYAGDRFAESAQTARVQTAQSAEESQAPEADAGAGSQPASVLATSTDVSGIVEMVMPSVVSISDTMLVQQTNLFGMTRNYEAESSGSGFIVGQNDTELLIATNNHVVSGAEDLEVTFTDDVSVPAAIKGTDSENDLAIIAVQLSDIPADTMDHIRVANLGDSDQLKVGQQVVAIGNALGFGESVTVGYVSALDREVKDENGTTHTYIQTDAAINPGNSGGPLLDLNGNVIGINAAKTASTEVEGMGYAIPISHAQEILNSLMTKKTRIEVAEEEQGSLGIQVVNINGAMAEAYGMPDGVYVYQIMEDGAAAGSELREKDIITAFDGQSISNAEELTKMLTYYEEGSQVTLTVQRLEDGEYQEQTVTITLGPKSDLNETEAAQES